MQSTSQKARIVSRLQLNVKREVPILPIAFVEKRSKETVYLIDGDLPVREALSGLLDSLDIRVVSFASVAEYFEHAKPGEPSCLIVDMQLPDINGADLQQRIGREMCPPIIFLSGQPDVPAAVRAMKAGAIEILTKPIDPAALVEALHEALAQDRKLRLRRAELTRLQQRLSLLTPREREVVPLIVGGLLNKQAASMLGISEVTLQIHRSQVMRKMEAESFADLVRMALKLRISHWRANNCSSELAARTSSSS
jgi:FixJ family two-component response regulator